MSKARKHKSPILKRLLNQIPEEKLDLTSDRLRLNQKINNALIRSGLSKSEFAKLMGVEPPHVTRWLKGEQSYTSDTLFKMGRVLNESFIDLGEKSEERKEIVSKRIFESERVIETQDQLMNFAFIYPSQGKSIFYCPSIESKHFEFAD